MTKRVTYTCKKCNWQDTILEQWSDIKPKRCGNKDCKTYFLKYPDMLQVDLPAQEITEQVEDKKPTKSYKKSKEDYNAQSN